MVAFYPLPPSRQLTRLGHKIDLWVTPKPSWPQNIITATSLVKSHFPSDISIDTTIESFPLL